MVNEQHQPFRLIMEIGAPMILPQAPTLDALLYAALDNHLDDMDDMGNDSNRTDSILNTMKHYLTWNETGGFFHGSALRIMINEQLNVSVAEAVRTDVIHKKLNSVFFKPTAKKQTYKKVLVTGGPYKTRQNKRKAYSATYIVFEGLGKMNAIADLITHYVLGVGYDAQNNAQGEILTIDTVLLEDDISVAIEKDVNRPVPVAYAKLHGLTGDKKQHGLTPPYYQKEKNTDVIMPKKIRLINAIDAASGQLV